MKEGGLGAGGALCCNSQQCPCLLPSHPFPLPFLSPSPTCRTYLYPGEDVSKRRYFLTVAVVMAGLTWWMGPLAGLFVVDPMIQLIASNLEVGDGWMGGLAGGWLAGWLRGRGGWRAGATSSAWL